MGEDLRAGKMGTGATVAFVGTVAEFCVDGGEDLLGSGGIEGKARPSVLSRRSWRTVSSESWVMEEERGKGRG